DQARAERYAPAALKQAYLRMLHSFEMRYAESAQLDARKAIADADSLAALTQALLRGIRAALPGGNAYSYTVTAALKYLNEQYANPDLQLGAVADSVCISPGHLSRRLKEETGKSFQDLLMQIRMESAKRLLQRTPDKVYAVAEKVGYQNYRTFVNAFVHYYGVKPKTFR
ncbi:MAG TPA: helix-turn-helix transcriptional regulator, partial [Clostridia bacterium]|nr:helix-turn-helix transcriptional regulator [Clostridia bacterium]